MFDDRENKYRPILEEDPPECLDNVDSPWDRAPDLEDYNQHAFRQFVLALRLMERARSEGEVGKTRGPWSGRYSDPGDLARMPP